MEEWRFITLRNIDPYTFQCVREVLTTSIGKDIAPSTLLVEQPASPLIPVGKNTNLNSTVRLQFCKEKGIPVIRTASPHGSSGFYDSNSIRCVLVTKSPLFPNWELFNRFFYESIVASLKVLGIQAEHQPGSNNIIIGQKKASTSSGGVFGKTMMMSCTLTLDFDYDLAEKAIISKKDMREWVTTINEELGRKVSFDEVCDAVKQGFRSVLGVEFVDNELTGEEIRIGEEVKEKYQSETWVKYGKWSSVKDYWRPE